MASNKEGPRGWKTQFFPGNQRRCGFSSNTGESKIQKSLEGNVESDEVPDKLQLEKASLQISF